MNMPRATIVRALFTGPLVITTHPPTPSRTWSIRIVDPGMPHWWEQLRHNLGNEHIDELWHLGSSAGVSVRVDDVLASTGNMSLREGLLCAISWRWQPR